MHVQHIETFHQKASVSRRELIAGLAAGTIIAMAGDEADAATVNDLDLLIRQTEAMRDRIYELENEMTAIRNRADRPALPFLQPHEIDEMYRRPHDGPVYLPSSARVRKFFAAYHKCIFGSDRSKAMHRANEKRALVELSRRIEVNRRWESRTGLDRMDREMETLVDEWIRSERKVLLYPCSSFSMVASKVAYIRRSMDGDDFSGEMGTAIILTMDGGASLAS